MNVALPPPFQDFADDQVRRGAFDSPEAVLRAGLSVLMHQARAADLDAAAIAAAYPGYEEQIAAGLRQARADQTTDGEAFFDELERDGL